jgi:hypothetical protein
VSFGHGPILTMAAARGIRTVVGWVIGMSVSFLNERCYMSPFDAGAGDRVRQAATRPLAHSMQLQRTYAAGVGRSCACSLAGTRCAPGARRSDQSEYPSHARPNPTGTAARGANDWGSSANAGDDTAPRPSRAAAQRDRIPARNVAMPNSRFPRMYTTQRSDHSVASAPTLVSPTDPVKIPKKLSTNFGESLARSGKMKASKKVKPVTSTSQTLKSTKPTRPSQPAASTCLAYSPAMPSRPKNDMAMVKEWTIVHVLVVTEDTT